MRMCGAVELGDSETFSLYINGMDRILGSVLFQFVRESLAFLSTSEGTILASSLELCKSTYKGPAVLCQFWADVPAGYLVIFNWSLLYVSFIYYSPSPWLTAVPPSTSPRDTEPAGCAASVSASLAMKCSSSSDWCDCLIMHETVFYFRLGQIFCMIFLHSSVLFYVAFSWMKKPQIRLCINLWRSRRRWMSWNWTHNPWLHLCVYNCKAERKSVRVHLFTITEARLSRSWVLVWGRLGLNNQRTRGGNTHISSSWR